MRVIYARIQTRRAPCISNLIRRVRLAIGKRGPTARIFGKRGTPYEPARSVHSRFPFLGSYLSAWH